MWLSFVTPDDVTEREAAIVGRFYLWLLECRTRAFMPIKRRRGEVSSSAPPPYVLTHDTVYARAMQAVDEARLYGCDMDRVRDAVTMADVRCGG